MVASVMTIAGSDSGGGAGIQADLKVMTAHKVYGSSVITAITSQNTLTVDAVQVLEADMVEKQFKAVMSDIKPDIIKTGMLGNQAVTKRVTQLLALYPETKSVIDPVMVATSGAHLLEVEAVDVFLHELIPKAFILTPNIQEARLLLHTAKDARAELDLRNVQDLVEMATSLQRYGPKYVLLKGGHTPLSADLTMTEDKSRSKYVCDVLCSADSSITIISEWSPSRNTHGTGCSLASAVACQLALGLTVDAAVRESISYIHGAIVESLDIGAGSGPLNHMYRLNGLPFSPYLIEHPSVKPYWQSYTRHQFVRDLGKGTLNVNAFKYFLQQDYLYLIQYARLQGLAAYKSQDLASCTSFARIILVIEEELKMHIEYCKGFGISEDDLRAGKESVACTVYTRYMESIGSSRDLLALQVALSACLIGYGEVGRILLEDPTTDKSSLYYSWILNYTSDEYKLAVSTGSALLEKLAHQVSASRLPELIEIFRRVTEYEALFWTEAMNNV